MAGVQFGGNNTSKNNCKKAVEPVVYENYYEPIVAGEQTALTTLLTVPTASPLGYGGYVDNRDNCFGLLLTITYWTGADCSDCTIQTLTSVVKQIRITPNSYFEIPDGFWSLIQYQTIDNTGAVAASSVDGVIRFTSSYTPECPSCVILAGDTLEPVARVAKAQEEQTKK